MVPIPMTMGKNRKVAAKFKIFSVKLSDQARERVTKAEFSKLRLRVDIKPSLRMGRTLKHHSQDQDPRPYVLQLIKKQPMNPLPGTQRIWDRELCDLIILRPCAARAEKQEWETKAIVLIKKEKPADLWLFSASPRRGFREWPLNTKQQ